LQNCNVFIGGSPAKLKEKENQMIEINFANIVPASKKE